MRIREYFTSARAVGARLGLGTKTLVAAAFGVALVAGSLVAFGAATEDVTQHNGMATHDAARLRFFTMHRSDLLVHASKVFTDIGAPVVLAVLALVSGYFFWQRGLHLALALAPAIALGVSGVAVAVTKSVVGRARPPVSLHLVAERDRSFPSGHATDSTAVLVAIALVLSWYVLRRPLTRLATLTGSALLSSAIGTSRLILGVHWPSDIFAGLALGLAVSLVVTIGAAALVRLTPPPVEQPTRLRRSAARLLQLLARQRRDSEPGLLAT